LNFFQSSCNFFKSFNLLHIFEKFNSKLIAHSILTFHSDIVLFTGIQQAHQSPGSPQVNEYFKHGYLLPDRLFPVMVLFHLLYEFLFSVF
jgi:hypothetical protein